MPFSHTPGPWFADKLQDRNAYNIFPSGATYALLTVAAPAHDGSHPYGQATEANARLIAAAPDLLEALQKLVRAIDRLPGNNPLDGLADEARDAINKATGA